MFFERVSLLNKSSLNSSWREMIESSSFTLRKMFSIKDKKIFCIGSCFAEQVRISIEKNLVTSCFPRYQDIIFDSSRVIVDTLAAGRFHMNYYSSASIRQEIARALGIQDGFTPIEVRDMDIQDGRRVNSHASTLWQDPYRREVFAKSKDELLDISHDITATINVGLHSAEVFVITLGLVEVFDISGKVFNQFPGYGDGRVYFHEDLRFRQQSACEVEKDLREIIRIIKGISENKVIIFSVSPIPLQKTFTDTDVFSANSYSKSTLRSAVERVIDPQAGIHYFPSYEIALNVGVNFFEQTDKRHAHPDWVEFIIKAFQQSVT